MRPSRLAILVALTGLLVGCEVNPDGPSVISFAALQGPLSTCAPISGNFAATSFRVTGLEPGVVRDFGLAGARLTMGFGATGRFRSEFLQPGLGPVIHNGFFTIAGDHLTLVLSTQPFLPGLRTGNQRFTCRALGRRILLTGDDLLFDFTGRGFFVLSRFEAELGPF